MINSITPTHLLYLQNIQNQYYQSIYPHQIPQFTYPINFTNTYPTYNFCNNLQK
jgi:hypothetical protein